MENDGFKPFKVKKESKKWVKILENEKMPIKLKKIWKILRKKRIKSFKVVNEFRMKN